ncbi:GntR family transcriptional regulator [Rhodococcus sp. USK10]|uniref:GntR family transcriptional regulator n=1 Tax=Rhodococcus sp. USK10 TaxID=2789739 RepID=UPI002150E3D6|nr:GntR family transcriptional regulator [Rhodococcus sp. USK10]
MTEHRYRTIADQLECEIDRLAPGTKLDSEHELMKRFGVGRAAARGAVQELERRLRVRRVQGAGPSAPPGPPGGSRWPASSRRPSPLSSPPPCTASTSTCAHP